jgi:spore coat polysaccharide biosynthesis protein SpsF (cytidylyltransferase family)
LKILGMIQARMSSTRLPNKVLLGLEGKSVLEHVVSRVARAKLVTDVVVATTIKKEDLEIVKLCSGLGFSVFCGSENDVLDRFYQAARLFEASHCVRITADCPMVDPDLIDSVTWIRAPIIPPTFWKRHFRMAKTSRFLRSKR